MTNERFPSQILSVLPVLTAGLYLFGMTYHQGYLSEYGLNDTMFPLDSDRALFTGFFSFLTLSIPALFYAVFATVFLTIALVIALVLSSSSRVRAFWTRVRCWLPKSDLLPADSNKTMVDLRDKSATLYGYLVLLLVLAILLVVMSVLSAKSGRELAKKELGEFANSKSMVTHVVGKDGVEMLRGYTIFCGDKFCAFWTGKQSLVVPTDDIARMLSVAAGGALQPDAK